MPTTTQMLYNIFFDMQKQPHGLFTSPDGSLTAVQASGKPVWVMTLGGISRDAVTQFCENALERFWRNGATGIVAEWAVIGIITQWLKKRPDPVFEIRELIAFYANKLICDATSSNIIGTLQKPSVSDISLLSEWVGAFHVEALRTTLSPERCEGITRSLVTNGLLDVLNPYRLRSENRAFTAMGMLIESSAEVARLNYIYTPFKGYGYGKAITALLSRRALDSGRIPMLYTYSENARAIAVYRSLGFAEAGRLSHIIFLP